VPVEIGHLPPNGRVRLVECCGCHGGSFGLEAAAEHGSQLSRSVLVGLDLQRMASLIRRRASVDGPCLPPLPTPVPGQILDCLEDVIGNRVHMGGLAGAAHGDISGLSASTIDEEVGGVEGGALDSMNRCGVPEGELVRSDLVGPESVRATVVHPHCETDGVGVDGDDLSPLGGDQLASGGRGEGDDAIPGLVGIGAYLQFPVR
jgi:hypothetical protein